MRAAYAASKSVGNTYLSNASKGTAAGSNKRRDHLKELMLTKIVSICNHHNWGPIDDAAREYASRQVDVLLRTGKVSGADLHRIASHIRAGSRPQRETQAHASVRQQKDAMSDVAAQSDVSSMRGTATAAHASHVSPAARTVASKDDSECDLWARMLRKDVEAWQSETQQHRQHRRQRMEEQRLALDKQIEAAQTLKIQTAEQEKFYAKQIAVQLEEWNHEQSRLDEKRKQTNLAEKKMRDDQLQVMRTKKAQEDRQRKHEDEQIIRKLHDDIKQEQVDKQHQKARARQEVHRYIEVNRAQNQAKERVIRDEAEMDRMHQLHHMAKLEQQDKERSEALKKIHDKQSRQVHIAQQLAASIGEKAADDERRADTEQRRKMEQMMKQEQEKEERAQHEREKMRSYLSQQIAEKEKARASRLKRQLEEKDLLARELLQAEQQETERRRAKKNKDMNHRKLIESQIQEKQQRKDVIMSDTEKRLNMKRLHTIK